MQKTIVFLAVLILAALASPPEAEAAGFSNMFRRNDIAGAEMLPVNGDLANLTTISKPVAYREANFIKYYGNAATRYIQYGMIRLVVCEYAYGGKDRRVTIEMASMETPTAATGIFHYVRGKVVRAGAKQIDVGAEGMLDTRRGGRNLYFYRSNVFVKVIYSGPDPTPDMLPIARLVDSKIPKGRDQAPDGFTYIQIPGVKQETVELTPGYTFNLDFLPPAVWASAPAGGSIASDLFIITRQRQTDAQKLVKEYTAYLRFNAEYVEEYRKGDIRYVKAVDPNQGRVLFTSHKNIMIIAARPDGYEKGEALIERVIQKIEEEGAAGRR